MITLARGWVGLLLLLLLLLLLRTLQGMRHQHNAKESMPWSYRHAPESHIGGMLARVLALNIQLDEILVCIHSRLEPTGAQVVDEVPVATDRDLPVVSFATLATIATENALRERGMCPA